MFFGPVRIISWLLGITVVAIPAAAVGFFIVAVVGSPGSCQDPERPITADLALAASFQEKWDQLNASLDAGQPASETFSEAEATSRARLWVEQHDVPVSDLYICFSGEGGSASAKVDVPFLPGDVDVLVDGTLLLTGEIPVSQIDSVSMGDLPGPVSGLVEGFVTDLVEDQAEDINLDHDYELAFQEGAVTISGTP